MGDTFIWRRGQAGDWNDPSNWLVSGGTRNAGDLAALVNPPPDSVPAERAPGPEDDVWIPAISVHGSITGGGVADTVLLQGDGLAVQLAGTGTERYAFRELFLGFGGSNLSLVDALLDVQSTFVPDGAFLSVADGAVGTDPDGRPYTASLGALTLEAIPGSTIGSMPSPGGRLILGDRDVNVTSLVQGALGVGNSFDPDAGIVGTGGIHYPVAVSPAEPYVTTPFAPFEPPGQGLNLPPPLDHLDFGTVEVGGGETLTFTVANLAGGDGNGFTGRPLVGAVQTAVNGGNITDPALSGSGVTPGNFYLPADVSRQDFTVTLTGDTPHSLEGQAVHLLFADGTGVLLPITGTIVGDEIPGPKPVDWNALAAQATANFLATGQWFVGEAPGPTPPGPAVDWDALAAQVTANFQATGQWFA
jgi:hypothetical protein